LLAFWLLLYRNWQHLWPPSCRSVSVVDGGLEVGLPIAIGTFSLPTDVAIIDEEEDDAKPNTNGNMPKDTLKPHGKSTLFSLI